MPQSDLGLVRDFITDVRRTAGSGEAGGVDTYTIFTEAHPEGIGTFTVQNGIGVLFEDFTSISDLKTWMADNAKKVLSMIFIDETNASKTITSAMTFAFDDVLSVAQTFSVYNGSTFNAVTSLATGESIRVFYSDQIYSGIVHTSVQLLANVSYASDADLVAAILHKEPFIQDDSGNMYRYVGGGPTYSYYITFGGSGDRISTYMVIFNTSTSVIYNVINQTFASTSDIQNLF